MSAKRLREVEKIAARVFFDEPAARHTSMGVGGKLACLAFPESEEELCALLAFAAREGVSYYAVGNWTNIIVADAGWEGLVISLREMKRIAVKDCGAGSYEITAAAGALLRDIVALCSSRGIAGMEFCAGIPGTLGGALKKNAGAFGKEMKDVVTAVRIMGKGSVITELPANALSFTYRDLALVPMAIIVSANIRLTQGDEKTIKQTVAELQQHRRERHPLEFRSAGSVFKNDKNWAAGRLIEAAGLKGKVVGGAAISNKHGNFIVNREGASAADVMSLVKMAQAEVMQRFGIALEMEIKTLGF